MQFSHDLPKEAIVGYVMKLTDDNPLRSFGYESGKPSDCQFFS